MAGDLNEHELIVKAQNGDVRAFSELVETYQERAIRIAESFVGNLEDARDLAQEAFVKSYESLPMFKVESKFYTWFYRILANTCKDFMRKKKTRKSILGWIVQDKDDESEENVYDRVVDRAPTAPQELASRELGDRIRQKMDELPFQQRTAFALRYLDGLSLEEIAQSMSLSVGAVKAHLWQAGQKMKKSLESFAEEG
jgi:RNA polymerase sigma-70 factor (ECF subfamily)